MHVRHVQRMCGMCSARALHVRCIGGIAVQRSTAWAGLEEAGRAVARRGKGLPAPPFSGAAKSLW